MKDYDLNGMTQRQINLQSMRESERRRFHQNRRTHGARQLQARKIKAANRRRGPGSFAHHAPSVLVLNANQTAMMAMTHPYNKAKHKNRIRNSLYLLQRYKPKNNETIFSKKLFSKIQARIWPKILGKRANKDS